MVSRVVAILLICLGLAQQLCAQQISPWVLSVYEWDRSVIVTNTITYRIAITNEGTLTLNSVFVTNEFSAPVEFVDATTTDITREVNPTNVIFSITRPINPGETFLFLLRVRPTRVGTLINSVTGTTPTSIQNPNVVVLTSVSAPVARSDLTVSITPPTPPPFLNDWVPYTVTVSRNGPDPISGVFVTNILPAGAIVRGYSPSNGVTLSSSNVIFDLGTVSLQNTQVNLTIQPTTLTNVFTATVGSPAGSETNSMNNSATNTLAVLQPVLGQLVATPIPPQVYNRQNSLIEQLIRVQNVSASNAVSARVIITNFPYRVVNAVGTNDGNPFVVHGATLGSNQTAELVLEHAIPDRMPKADPGLTAYSGGNIDLTAPSSGTNNSATPRGFLPANDLVGPDSRFLIEFPAERGATYLILYSTSTNTMFGDPRKAQPPIVAQANRVQWIDYGPPKTLTRPTNIMRFYRVIRLP